MIRAIIFDFGLVISSPRPTDTIAAYEKDLGLTPGSIHRIMFDSPAWQEALLGRLTMQAFWYAIGPSLGLVTPKSVDAFRRRYYADESVNPFVLEIIQRLFGRYLLAVLSNHPPGLDQWLIDWKIRDFFDVVVCSGDEGRVKPDPAVYRITLDRLGVQPREAIFIDDTAGHVAAAQALNIHGIVFKHARQLTGELDPLLD
jgi:putative hydrolase of the HAD superfamily